MLLVIAVLKVGGLLLAGGFSILGLTTEFKEKTTGKITPWGKVAIYGALFSTLISVSSQAVESWQAQKDAASSSAATKKQLESITELLHGMDRVLNPIYNLVIRYRVTVPLGDEALSNYRNRLNEGTAGGGPIMFMPGTFQLSPEIKRGEDIAYNVMMCIHLGLEIFPANSLNASTLRILAVPDLAHKQTNLFVPGLTSPDQGYFEYDKENSVLHIDGVLTPNPDQFESQGDMTYLADLKGGAINVVLFPLPAPCSNVNNQEHLDSYYRIINTVKLEELELSVSGRHFALFSNDFRPRHFAVKTETPANVLLQAITKRGEARVTYRASIPIDLKAIEEKPAVPTIIIETSDGSAAVAK
jgi:hypothetical protein